MLQQPAVSSGGPALQRASATGKIVRVFDTQDAVTGCGTSFSVDSDEGHFVGSSIVGDISIKCRFVKILAKRL